MNRVYDKIKVLRACDKKLTNIQSKLDEVTKELDALLAEDENLIANMIKKSVRNNIYFFGLISKLSYEKARARLKPLNKDEYTGFYGDKYYHGRHYDTYENIRKYKDMLKETELLKAAIKHIVEPITTVELTEDEFKLIYCYF